MKIFIMLMAALMAQACNSVQVKGNGNVATKTYQTEGYDKIHIYNSFDVSLIEGNVGEIRLNCEENFIKHIIIESRNGRLTISVEENVNLFPTNKNKIEVTVPFDKISEVSISGSGDVRSFKDIVSDELELSISGSGKFTATIQVGELEADISGSGKMNLEGQARDFDGNISGSGKMSAANLVANNVDMNVSGSGSAEVYCSGILNAEISGSGKIYYTGNPDKVNSDVSGSGSVKDMVK